MGWDVIRPLVFGTAATLAIFYAVGVVLAWDVFWPGTMGDWHWSGRAMIFGLFVLIWVNITAAASEV